MAVGWPEHFLRTSTIDFVILHLVQPTKKGKRGRKNRKEKTLTGNRTPVSHVTGRETRHYTIKDCLYHYTLQFDSPFLHLMQ